MRKAVRMLSGVLVILLAWQVSLAQTRIVSGTVKDVDGEAVIGASVIAKGTTTGTYTDVDGNYSLAVPSTVTTLLFKYLGYKTVEMEIGASNVANVTMEEDVLGLDEVVVTAIGISKEKKALGYSAQDLSGDQITAAGNNNALSALSGKIAGLQVISSSGSPGSSVYLELRGSTSIAFDNSPLFVVDGVPIDNSYNYSGNPDNVGALINNNLLESVNNSNRGVDINPDDIESISVLKGPAATALYGTRAAHGAILITTKKGGSSGSGKGIHVTYSMNYTVEKVSQLPALQDQFIKGTGNGIATYESGSSGSWGAWKDTLFWDPSQETPFNQNGQLIGASEAANTPGSIPFAPFDNVDQFFRNGNTFENNIAFSGGTENSGFRFSFGALNQDGVVPLSTFDRYTTKIAGQASLSSKFSTSGSVSYINSGGSRVQQGSNLSGLMLDLLRTPISFDNSNGSDDPEDPSAYVFEDGTQRNYRGGGGYDNPYWSINQNPFKDDVNRIFGFGEINYTPYTWLRITERVGTDFYSDRRDNHFAINSRAFTAGQTSEQDYFYRHVNNDLNATATRDFGDKFSGSLTLGHGVFGQFTQQVYVEGNNLVIPNFYNISNAADVQSRNFISKYRTYAFYGSVDLSYNRYLYLTLTGRDEFSSTLPEDKNSFFYPSAAVSFVFTDAFGMSNNKILPYGKLRLSYAQVGNDAPVYVLKNVFTGATAADGWTTGLAFPLPDRNGNSTTGYQYAATLGNPLLEPELTSAFEAGIDLRFLQNRIGLDLTYYTTKSDNQIIPAPIAGSSGSQQQFLNSGSIKNNGFEIQLSATPVKSKDFKWDLGVNWSMNNSEVVALANGVDALFMGGFEGSAIYAVVGEEYGSIYGGRWLRDENGNVIIESDSLGNLGYPIVDPQVGIIGNINPDWIAGISTTLSWKGISLYALFDIRQGGDMWNGTKGALTFFGRSELTETRGEMTTFEGVLGHLDTNTGEVTTEGVENTIEVPLGQTWYQGNGGGFGSQSEAFIEDGSYMKLKELSLSYSLERKWLESTPIYGIDISLIGRNLWLSTDYTGVDPETSLTGANNSQGMDYFNMPGTKSYGISLRLTL